MAIRTELYIAYRKEFGIQHLRPVEDGGMKSIHAVPTSGSISEDQAKECLERILVLPSSEQVSRYDRHGLGRVSLKPSGVPEFFLIDTHLFRNPQHAWLKGIKKDRLDVLVSSGQQETIKKRTKSIDEEEKNWFVDLDPVTIQGLLITLRFPRSSAIPEITPLTLK